MQYYNIITTLGVEPYTHLCTYLSVDIHGINAHIRIGNYSTNTNIRNGFFVL